ncbi:ABC transporter ATP-binding protein [Hydrogenothermus marinus]|uniref:Molybdate transport system ATP-binding protein n=1 Tax=Hydrogenothermus marinus TaxID=133270 RepID=A0A3M0BKB9_9AQUI|nr:ATP-binding cassette domain-containing protein [Hydrogenothermus marinus]RMA97913.1 molybdate transport system ATP-binding protein [Hydrogenothermus marinus]
MIKIKIKKKLISTDIKPFYLDIDLQIKNNQFITIFGKSGSGKTTILRTIAGLEKADEGFIHVVDEVWLDTKKGINLPPQKRKIGFLFQDYALFPNMNVEENIKFAMEKEDKNLLEELLEILDIKNLRKRNINTLSGGQKQRVALARAIARKPKILLLDEPLSALDYQMRQMLQKEILKIHKRFNLTTIMVSHDRAEVFKMSEKVIVIENGKIIKEGTPEDVFLEEKISGKVKIYGEILDIKKEDIVYVITILVGNDILKVVATEEEIKGLKVGDLVLLSVKAFSPIIIKV